MAPQLQIRCLGRLNLRCCEASAGASSELPLPATLKSQSLLAYLAVHRDRPHSRDHLAGIFWGDRPERNARRSLATALWQIRRCLPVADFILAETADVQINPRFALWLDVAEFESVVRIPSASVSALQEAVDLYRGYFLEGFYDDWVLSERYRLESLYCDALAQLMAALEVRQEHPAALAVALRLLEQDPLREDAHRAAMRAYCRLGQRHAALAQYRRCQQALQVELGVSPMAETVALHQAIVDGHLACEPGPPVAVAPPVPPRPAAARHPLDAAGQIPLVGREQELAFLAGGWQAAIHGACSLVLVSGEAGVGKTRLVQEFADQQRWHGVRVLQGRCYEFERLLPYQPVVELLRSLPPALARTACATVPDWVIAQVAHLAPELLAPELALPGTVAGQPGEEQPRLFEAVSRFLAQLAGQDPLLLIFEDLHWASESTLQLLHYLARHLMGLPLLLVGTLRPEAVPPAGSLATLGRRLERDGLARRLPLSRLSPAAVATLIGQLSGDGQAVRSLADRLYVETEGNPFYLIQTVKALFEAGAIRMEAGAWQADFAALGQGRLPLPASVSEMIAARVDRLSQQTQEAVQVAAVVGREFDFDLLHAAWGQGEDATLAALDDLLRQRLVEDAAAAGITGPDYTFTHHTIQEVIYSGLSRRRRQRLHAQVGTALEHLLGAECATRAAELAFHFEQAQQLDQRLADRAIAYFLQAGQQAERQSANQEAMAYFRRGLDVLHALPPTPQRRQQEVELQIALTVPTTVVHGYASPETRRVYDRARELCGQIDDTPALFTALAGLSRYYGVSGDTRAGLELAQQALVIAQAAEDTPLLLEACRAMGGVLFSLGRLPEARAFLEQGAALYDLAQHERQAYRFGHDPAVVFHGYLGLTVWLLGYSGQAAVHSQRLLALIQSFSHPSSLAYAHCWLAKDACARRDAQVARHHAEEAIGLGQTYGLPSWTAAATALRGWALAEQGQAAEGLAQLQEGITRWRATGFAHWAPFCLALQAECCLKAHRLEEGIVALAAARAIAQSGGDTYWLAEVDRLQGELSQAQGKDSREAEAHFCAALDTARRQAARMLELRAAMSLARLWQSQGNLQAARQILAEVYGRFDEGFATHDLQAASALLEALS